jgi:hypothetical protein
MTIRPKITRALDTALNLAESVVIPDYPFPNDKYALSIIQRLIVLWDFLSRRFHAPKITTTYEITALVNYEADKRMLTPLLMNILQGHALNDCQIRVNLVHHIPLSQEVLCRFRSLGCSVATNNLSLIRACARPSDKIVLLCLDHRFFYEYHKAGVDAADTLRRFSVKTISIQHGGSREDSVRGMASSASDIFLVWGRRVFRELVHRYQVNQSKLRLVGNPLHDSIPSVDEEIVIDKIERRYPGFEKAICTKKVVLLATCLHYEYREFDDEQRMYTQWIKDVYESLDYSKTILIVKMHPTDYIDPNSYLQHRPAHLAESILIVEPGIPGLDVYSLLKISDLLLTRASTVAEEALLMGKPVIAFDLIERGPSKLYKHLEEYEIYRTVYADSTNTLKDAVFEALFLDRNFMGNSIIEDDFTYLLDGRSTDRAVSEIFRQLFDSVTWTGAPARNRRRQRFLISASRMLATALKKLKSLTQEPYEFYGRDGDGWMAPYGIIRVVDPKPRVLRLDLEIPGWLPFEFPVSIKAVQNDRQIAVLQASAPGYPTLTVPLTQSGIIELSADQWFIPEELGLSHDNRRLCYRVSHATCEEH